MLLLHKSFFSSLLLILTTWILWYFYTFPQSFQIISDNWPITVTMVFGSFIAGATSEGGGAIAFPVFTKILHISPLDAKVFSLAIQSVGMTAATITIVVMAIKVEWRVVLWASIGGVFGVFLGAVVLTPYLPADLLKMLFTTLILSVALTLLLLNCSQRQYNERLIIYQWREKCVLLCSGILGGIMTGLVGNGIDIVCFSVMVLLFRLSAKIATATSVVLMAVNALVGFFIHLYLIESFSKQIEMYWLSAVPVVVVGAPLGAYFCSQLSNKTVESILVTLIMLELTSSLILIPMTPAIVQVCAMLFLLCILIYYRMYKVSRYRPNLEKSH